MGQKDAFDALGGESFKAFTITLLRLMCKNPDIALMLNEIGNKRNSDLDWSLVYNQLQDKDARERLYQSTTDLTLTHDWSKIQEIYELWGQYGWITDNNLFGLEFWDDCPQTQTNADKKVLQHLNTVKLKELFSGINKKSTQKKYLEEIITCFENKCYTACASLLISLIDGELIKKQSRNKETNKKTGSKASNKITVEMKKTEEWGYPGFLNLELLNYEIVINTLFENADGFQKEPKRVNRNYLHHGMSKRKVLKKDCIKLFLVYYKTLEIMELQKEVSTNDQL